MVQETGIYLRIKRKEGWVNVDVAEMTDEEIENFVDNMSVETAKKWVRGLFRFIREQAS